MHILISWPNTLDVHATLDLRFLLTFSQVGTKMLCLIQVHNEVYILISWPNTFGVHATLDLGFLLMLSQVATEMLCLIQVHFS